MATRTEQRNTITSYSTFIGPEQARYDFKITFGTDGKSLGVDFTNYVLPEHWSVLVAAINALLEKQ